MEVAQKFPQKTIPSKNMQIVKQNVEFLSIFAFGVTLNNFVLNEKQKIYEWRHCMNREIKIHVYAKRQTSDSSWEFLRIENKQIKTVEDNCYV